MKSYHFLTVGLLGGSFNPAHLGHLHISLKAMQKLGLNEVWWLVSPQNPLKERAGMAPYKERVAKAQETVKKHPRIKICEIESQLGLQYTADTLNALKKRHPRYRFVWIMGSDNLAQFHRWKNWRQIAASLPILVCDRMPAAHKALRSPAALALQRYRLNHSKLQNLTKCKPPCWGYFFMPRHPESATRLRNMLGERAFLGHNHK